MKHTTHSPWYWVPSLYLAESIPYAIVMTVSVIMFKRLGISNADLTLYTGWLYLPWVIKPLWSPIVDIFKTKRWWIIGMQFLIGISLACVALSLPGDNFFRYSLAFLWLLAFSSATHDIAADGFYMIGLNERQQAYFVGIRTTFYRLGMIAAQGGLVIIAGFLENRISVAYAWSVTIGTAAALFFLFFLYHCARLPKPTQDAHVEDKNSPFKAYLNTFVLFFKKEHIGSALLFILLFRFAEAQLVKLSSPFLLEEINKGGLGLSTQQVGLIYGTIGVIALTIGGISGGILIARDGLNKWLWPMVLAMNLPNLLYVYLAWANPENLFLISSCVAIEQFGYGFGFTAYSIFLILFCSGSHKTAHYALCTGIMALGMMLPGMISGWIQEQLGYLDFFIWVGICTIPSFLVTRFLKIPNHNS